MSLAERLENAHSAAEPAAALRALALELFREGRSEQEIREALESFLLQLRTRPAHQESDEDAVLDVLDALTGWCHPDARLLQGKDAHH